MGFTHQPAIISPSVPALFDAYYWRQMPNQDDKRICVAFGARDQCCGGTCGWVWQTSTMSAYPAFGYSGSTHCGASFGTLAHVMDITLEHFYSEGFHAGYRSNADKVTKIKSGLQSALKSASDVIERL